MVTRRQIRSLHKSVWRVITVCALMFSALIACEVALTPSLVSAEQPKARQPVKPVPSVATLGVTGVDYPNGQFRLTGQNMWTENEGAFNFTEVSRDATSVFLQDESRGVRLQLDLKQKQIIYSDANTKPTLLYAISKVLTSPSDAKQPRPKKPLPGNVTPPSPAVVNPPEAAVTPPAAVGHLSPAPPVSTPNPELSVATGEKLIDLGEPPLSDAEMNAVMTWISARVSALTVPFCWRQSYGNTAGKVLVCPSNLEQNGGLCYTSCKLGYAGAGPVCWQTCDGPPTFTRKARVGRPPQFRDDGAFCFKPEPYGRGAGYVVWDEAACKRDGLAKESGGCEQCLALHYPKCKPGFHATGCNICSPDCPAGMTDIGISCAKQSYGRGAGTVVTACEPGMEKDPAGALCYPTCKADYHMVGPVCWQNCPAQQPFECAAGCATNQGECASGTANQVISPITAAISLVTFGAGAAVAKGVQAASAAARFAASANRLKASYQAVKRAMELAKGNLKELVGGAENFEKLKRVKKVGGKVYAVATDIGQVVDQFSQEFADNFDVLTSPEIGAEIDKRFGKEAARQVKRQWGIRHLTLMLQTDGGFQTAQSVVSTVAAVDPTGLVGVADAFMKPICSNNAPFPVVHPLYTR